MNIEVFTKIFSKLDIEMLYDDKEIRAKTIDSEAYYGLEISDLQCYIFSYQRGIKTIKYSFESRNTALKYFMIFMVKKCIINRQINSIITSNPILYDDNVTYNNIRTILKENGIETEKAKDYILELKQREEYYEMVIINKKNKEEIYFANKMNRPDALFIFLQWSCTLYKYVTIIKDLQKEGFELEAIEDEDIIALFTMN